MFKDVLKGVFFSQTVCLTFGVLAVVVKGQVLDRRWRTGFSWYFSYFVLITLCGNSRTFGVSGLGVIAFIAFRMAILALFGPSTSSMFIFPQQQNAMVSLRNIDFGVFWASWGGSGEGTGFREPVPGTCSG